MADQYSYVDLGYSPLLSKETSLSLDDLPSGSSYNGTSNLVTDSVSTSDLESGEYAEHLIISDDGHIRGGATDYNEGTGFWLGNYLSTRTYNFFIGNASGNKLTWDGTTLSITGALTATTGAIGGWTVDATTIYSGSGATTVALSSAVTGADDIRIYAGSATASAAPFRVTEAGVLTASSATITGALTTGAGSSINGTYLVASSVLSGSVNLALMNWTLTSVFSVTDADTVAWGTGTLTTADGTGYSIAAGNTGNMAARTFVYLDTAVSTTVLQTTTTAATAVGNGKLMVMTAINGTNEATYVVFSGAAQTNIDGGSIALLSITAGEIAAATITGGKIAAATITATNITSGTITTNEIAANTIVGGNISSLNISTKTLVADTGTVGGWTMGAASLTAGSGSTTVGLDVTVTGGDDIRIYAGSSTMASAPFRVTESGALVATSATISGAITATSGVIGGWTVNSTSIYTGTEDHSAYTANAGDITIYSDGADASIHAKNFYIDSAGVLNCTAAVIAGGITTTSGSSVDGQYLTAASVASASANLALRGWIQTSAFTVTDADTIAWGSGTFTASDGTAYSISASNTGNMAAKTYVYLDIAASTTAYQTTTTAATAVGNGKVMVAICVNGTGEASFMLLNNNSYNIDASNIVAASITTNEIAATTITGTNINTLSITGKTVLFDTGTIGGWTLSSTTLTNTSGGNTTTFSTGTNSLIIGPTGSPTITMTAAGALTATSATITGAITATSGAIGGWVVTSTAIKDAAGTVGMSSAVTGGDDIRFFAGNVTPASAPFYVTEAGVLVASSATITGSVTATSGTIGGFSIGADYVRDAADSFGLASTVTGGDDVRFWAGDTFANRATADFRVTESGVLTATGATVNGTTLGFQDLFGDGSDGNVTITTDTSLSRDMFYENLTINYQEDIPATFYTTTSGLDGYWSEGTDGSFATMRAVTSSDSVSESGGLIDVQITTAAGSNTFSVIKRAAIYFDTSSLPDGAVVDSGTVAVYVTTKTETLASQSISLVKKTSVTDLTAISGYNITTWDTTKQAADVTIASLTTSAYNTWTLNATGCASVNVTGTTYFGFLMACDADNSAPTWSASTVALMTFNDAEAGSNLPTLTISYHLPSTAIVLNPSGYRIHVENTLTINGTISRNGNNGGVGGNGTDGQGLPGDDQEKGVGGTGGTCTALASGTLFGSLAGGSGAAGADGVETNSATDVAGVNGIASSAGANATHSGTGENGVAGGAGGGDTGSGNVAGSAHWGSTMAGGSAASAGAGGTATPALTPPRTVMGAWHMADIETTGVSLISSGAVGSGGAGGASGAVANLSGGEVASGGGGGGGAAGTTGGVIAIFAKNIVVGSAGTISANGGDGGAGGNAGTGDYNDSSKAAGGSSGGGGGAGGAGGLIALVYSSLTNSGVIEVEPGVGGAGGTKSAGVGTGTARAYDYAGAFADGDYAEGTNGSTGSTGNDGLIVQLIV